MRLESERPGGATLEFRGADPSANPYLLLAGLLVSGAHGLGTSTELPPAFEEEIGGFDPAGDRLGARRAAAARPGRGPRRAPRDDVLVDAFDPQLLSRLVDGRRAEASEYRAQVTPWEIERYLDEA